MIDAGTDGTDPDAWVSFNFNGTDARGACQRHPSLSDNEFVTFDMVFEGVEGEDFFTIMSHGTQDDNQGLLIDSITIHDWHRLTNNRYGKGASAPFFLPFGG